MLSQTAFAGLSVFTEQVAACFVHGFYHKVKRNLAGMGQKIGQTQSIDGTHGGHGVPFYTRYLDKTVYQVAGQSQMMFHGNFGGIFYLIHIHVIQLSQSCRRHGAGLDLVPDIRILRRR